MNVRYCIVLRGVGCWMVDGGGLAPLHSQTPLSTDLQDARSEYTNEYKKARGRHMENVRLETAHHSERALVVGWGREIAER